MVSPMAKTTMARQIIGTDAAAGSCNVDSRMIQKRNQNAATTPITRVRLLPSMRFNTQSCASTMVVVLKKKMTPIVCTDNFKLFTTNRLSPASSDPYPPTIKNTEATT